jgi:hypothetical protein
MAAGTRPAAFMGAAGTRPAASMGTAGMQAAASMAVVVVTDMAVEDSRWYSALLRTRPDLGIRPFCEADLIRSRNYAGVIRVKPIEGLLFRAIVFLRAVFDIAVKPHWPSLFPILRVVFIDAGTMSQKAVELASRRIHHDSDVSAPNYQITGLRFFHPAKIISSAVKVGGVRIRIREAGLLVNGMHQV